MLFEARAARRHARQHACPAGRNLTELSLPVLRANYVCSENSINKIQMEEIRNVSHFMFLVNTQEQL